MNRNGVEVSQIGNCADWLKMHERVILKQKIQYSVLKVTLSPGLVVNRLPSVILFNLLLRRRVFPLDRRLKTGVVC